MGTYYGISPINEETKPLLNAMGIRSDEEVSRYPNLDEILAALDELAGCTYEVDDLQEGKKWDARITCEHEGSTKSSTRMTILSLAPSSSPQEFYFAKGAPDLILRILAKITNSCGALAIFTDGMSGLIVPPDSDPELLLGEWLNQQEKTG